jgi:hypothetical protein
MGEIIFIEVCCQNILYIKKLKRLIDDPAPEPDNSTYMYSEDFRGR